MCQTKLFLWAFVEHQLTFSTGQKNDQTDDQAAFPEVTMKQHFLKLKLLALELIV